MLTASEAVEALLVMLLFLIFAEGACLPGPGAGYVFCSSAQSSSVIIVLIV
jgi:hypothetical protein